MTLKNLPEFKQYLRARGAEKLYEIAKQVTLDAGFPYTDPRTLETTQPKPKGKTNMCNSTKMPKWVLLDQLHIDVNIKSDMPAKERRELKRLIDSEPMQRLFKNMIEGPHRNNIRVTISR